ncbi:hypothetical protein PRZ48_007305 [Zasmidium cellare]|uniref:Uncharacterized protein n=1 Tax=Zasmidium cellare TaxID=395010 RepID=A0ABR0EIZ3_ZASCE|nr:hypothetical protein PRZ48_007305 [Zasmidium cellare]
MPAWSTIIIGALAATGAIAAPRLNWVSNSPNVIVGLVNRQTGANEQIRFFDVGVKGGREVQKTVRQDLYNEYQLFLGPDAINQQLRCAIFDKDGKIIILRRGNSVQLTGAGGNPWTFEFPKESAVFKVECNDEFKLGENLVEPFDRYYKDDYEHHDDYYYHNNGYVYDNDKHDEYRTEECKPTETYSTYEHKPTDYKPTETHETYYHTPTPTHY